MSNELPTLTTRLAHAGWDDHVLRGASVFGMQPAQLLVADVAVRVLGGPEPTPESRAVVCAVALATLNADPRIPPMKMVRLGAAFGGAVSGLAAGLAGLDGALVGMTAIGDAARWLAELRDMGAPSMADADLDAVIAERLEARRPLYGFGVPGRPVDERVAWLTRQLAQVATGLRPVWQLFGRVGARVYAATQRLPNIAGVIAAALLDLGFDGSQVEALTCFTGLLPLLGNAHEGAFLAPAAMRALPYDRAVRYVGAGPRVSPRTASSGG